MVPPACCRRSRRGRPVVVRTEVGRRVSSPLAPWPPRALPNARPLLPSRRGAPTAVCTSSSSRSASRPWAPRSPPRACLAPFFGASTIVWANTIATVLVALSIGYWLGGSIADRRPGSRPFAAGCSSGGLVALVPLVAQPFLYGLGRGLRRDRRRAAVGSLVGVLALVAVPVLVLGAVAPWAIRLRVASVEDAGRTAGRLYALSTGRLADRTVRGGAVRIPLLGTQRTFIVFALLAGARRRARPAAPLRARPGCGSPRCWRCRRHDEGPRRRPRPRRARDGVPVRAGGRAARRRAPARAQRGPGFPLGLAAATPC